jgi:predicted O-methyltransferase YrrM
MNYHDVAMRSEASQDKGELERLLTIVGTIQPKTILEIGVHLGRSMRVWNEAFEPTWLYGLEKDTCYDYTEVPGVVLKGVDSGDPNVMWRVHELLEGKKIDFLFIDGDHLYQPVLKDFLFYGAMVRPGGIVACHDIKISDNPTCEVYKFWAELKKQGYKFDELLSDSGTGTGVVYM